MTLAKHLLEKLVCPNCKSKLIYEEADNRLKCENCSLCYEIHDDIPVLICNEAKKI